MPTIVYPPRDVFVDFPDNKNNAISLLFAGCSHYCLGCHNMELQHPENGNTFIDNEMEAVKMFHEFSKRFETKCVVLSGGDPLHPDNREFVKRLTVELDAEDFKVAIYTGYEVDKVKEMALTGFEFLKCGKYRELLKQEPGKTEKQLILASKNQKIYGRYYQLLSHNGIMKF